MQTMREIMPANARRSEYILRIGPVEPLPNGGALFLSSEQFQASNGWRDRRRHSIRMAHPDGSIETVGDFQAFETRGAAVRMMRKLAAWCRS